MLTAILMIVLMALLALSIDTGYMYTMQTELDRSVDAAALAGAASLVEGTDEASDKVVEYLVRNPVGGDEGAITDDRLAEFTTAISWPITPMTTQIQIGNWNPDTGQLEPAAKYPSAVEVSMRYPNLPLFFGRVLGKDDFSIEARAIAMYQPRDIALVLDYSGSMNDDSEFKSIGNLGYRHGHGQPGADLQRIGFSRIRQSGVRAAVHRGRRPGTGGRRTAADQCRVSLSFGRVASTLDLSNVVSSSTPTVPRRRSAACRALSGTFAGTGSQAGKWSSYVWVKSGDNRRTSTSISIPARSTARPSSALELDRRVLSVSVGQLVGLHQLRQDQQQQSQRRIRV